MMNLLIPGEAGQRALEETLADWREARAQAPGAARIWCELQGVASIIRVIIGIGLREMARPASIRNVAVTVGIALLVTVIIVVAGVGVGVFLSALDLLPMLLAGLVPLALPLAATFGFGWRRVERPPVLGALALVLIVQLVLLTVVIPAANSLALQYLWNQIPPSVRTERALEMPQPPTGAEIVLSAYGLAVIVAVPVLALLGAAVRRRLRRRAYWVGQAVTGLVLTVVTAGVYGAWLWLVRWLDPLIWPSTYPRRGIIPEALWSIVVLAALIAYVVARKPRPSDITTPNPDLSTET